MRFFIAALAAFAVMALNFEIDLKPSEAKEVTEKVGGNERPALSADDADNTESRASALTGPPETTAVSSPAEEETTASSESFSPRWALANTSV